MVTSNQASNQLYRRHQRHARFDRLRYGGQELAFLAAQGARISDPTHNVTLASVSAAAATAIYTNTGTNFADGNLVVIGNTVYKFQTVLTPGVAGEVHVLIGGSVAASMANLFHAVNNSGGTGGTDYDTTGTTANPVVTATNSPTTAVNITARVAGAAGNSISLSEASDVGKWSSVFMAGGHDSYTTFTATAHGFLEYEGPVSFTASHTPSDIAITTEFFVHVVDVNTIRLALSLGGVKRGEFIHSVDVSGSTFRLARPVNAQGVFELLKTNGVDALKAASSIDTLT